MSRFHRMNAPRYSVWEPPELNLRIEYSTEVLRQAARYQQGVLYGVRKGPTLRVVAARRAPTTMKSGLLGVFVTRARGEVFLTESDLEHLEKSGGSIALVVAGTNAGFFVREPNGVIQTIKSYREFALAAQPQKPKADRSKLWISAACLAALAASIAIPAIPRARPLNLTVRGEARQLRISWNSNAFAEARLEISDGAARVWIPVAHDLRSATYVPVATDVRIRLIAGARSEDAHFVGIDLTPAIDQVKQLEAETESLHSEAGTGRKRAAFLQAAIGRKLATLK
jgi:hypothetical protein